MFKTMNQNRATFLKEGGIILALTLFMLNVADVCLTAYGFINGWIIEANPLLDSPVIVGGVTYEALAIKLLIAAVCCIILHIARNTKLGKLGMKLAIVVYSLVVIYSSIGIILMML